MPRTLKEHSQLWDRAELDTSFFFFHSQSFTEKPVFECVFVHPIIVSIIFGWKQYESCLCVIYKLAMKWYLMRMCVNWLRPFNAQKQMTNYCYTLYGKVHNVFR